MVKSYNSYRSQRQLAINPFMLSSSTNCRLDLKLLLIMILDLKLYKVQVTLFERHLLVDYLLIFSSK